MDLISPEVEILSDAESLSRRAAQIMIHDIKELEQERKHFTIALSGGSTPKTLYSLMATDDQLRTEIPWEKMHFFWGDERHVPPDHPESNYHMTQKALLEHVPITAENIHRVRAEDPDAAKTAENYEKQLSRFFNLKTGDLPRFDWILLGMGPDGHTASLFPDTAALNEQKRLVVANWVEKFQTFRITFTYPVLNNGVCAIFLVSGHEKAAVLQQVLENDSPYPAQRVRPTNGRLVWLVDKAAAMQLKSKEAD